MPFPYPLPRGAHSIRNVLLPFPGPLQMDLLCIFQNGPLCLLQIFLTSLSSLVFANPPSSVSLEDFVHVLFPPSSRAVLKPSKHSRFPWTATRPALSIFSDLQSPENPQMKTQIFPQQTQAHEPHTSAGHG